MNSESKPIRDWQAEYSRGTAPWDTGRVSIRLREFVESGAVKPGVRALELGCGAGTNSVFLAQSGFGVTAVDLTLEALKMGMQRADEAGVKVDWIQADVLELADALPAGAVFDFVFDRGCFHVFPPEERPRFLAQLVAVTRPGSVYFMLCGNAREPRPDGPPVVPEEELRAFFQDDFEIRSIEEFRLHTTAEGPGPLAYACKMVRKP